MSTSDNVKTINSILAIGLEITQLMRRGEQAKAELLTLVSTAQAEGRDTLTDAEFAKVLEGAVAARDALAAKLGLPPLDLKADLNRSFG